MRKALTLLFLAGLLVSQGEVDFNIGGNGSGRYEKTTSFVLTGEKKHTSPKTAIVSSPTLPSIGIQPKRIIRIPVTPKDVTIPSNQ